MVARPTRFRHWFWPASALVLGSSLAGCSLIGVEPDEIDFVDDGTGEGGSAGGSESGAESQTTTGMNGDGDGDAGDGDGDADPTTSSGDGDGDPAGQDCAMLEATELELGPNPVAIPAGPSLSSGACGADGPEAVFSYTSDADVNLELALTGFDAALYAIDSAICVPVGDAQCVSTPTTLTSSAGLGTTVYFVVDAIDVGGGSGELTLSIVP